MGTSNKPQYDFQEIEKKWLKLWDQEKLFQNSLDEHRDVSKDEKMYLLFAFAYPSGSGLHVGHVESKTALDIIARYSRMQGKKVFFPVGWDAFGLPAENYAIKTGVHPKETTHRAIDTFRRQIKRLAISYDWESELATCHPGYYKWTQWLFLKLFEKDFAYKKKSTANWCPSCKTVLANEQVVDGMCERCDSEVIQKELEQWFFKITEYQDELLEGLEGVDWPRPTKLHQTNWIGKKEGINIDYPVEIKTDQGQEEKAITCFTTRPDTNFGATFIVLAPEHDFVEKIRNGEIKPITGSDQSQKVEEYYQQAIKKTELDRQKDGRKKTGVFTGFYAVNNLNGRKLPIWVSDFVLGNFGTGAVIGVPGHDKRDFEFAKKFDLDVIRVVVGDDGDESPITSIDQVKEETGTMVNSEFLNGMDIHEAIVKIMDHFEEKGWGERVTTYKLRDWLISRQRYWGAPIPIVYDPEGNPHPVKEEHLPWKLPTDVDFKPTGDSPLKTSEEFIKRTEELYGEGWRPEFDTMDTFVDSSWYYLRYLDPRNDEEFARKERLDQWLPADLYIIGPEHIVLHLLYSRFLTKFLRDHDFLDLPSGEPFKKMRHQGMILGPDGKKMSKSKGNVINPDIVVEKYGADTLRMYEMFVGPLEADKPWDDRAVAGVHRFLTRIYRLVCEWLDLHEDEQIDFVDQDHELVTKLHQSIEKVSQDIPKLKFNTAIAFMMEFVNLWQDSQDKKLTYDQVISFIKLLAPFAPFISEEIYHMVNLRLSKNDLGSVHQSKWPEYDQDLVVESEITVAVQVNGKVRGQLDISVDRIDDQEYVQAQARSMERIEKWLEGKQIKRVIYVKGEILNFVI